MRQPPSQGRRHHDERGCGNGRKLNSEPDGAEFGQSNQSSKTRWLMLGHLVGSALLSDGLAKTQGHTVGFANGLHCGGGFWIVFAAAEGRRQPPHHIAILGLIFGICIDA